jgi:hypothetical protein
VQDEIARIRRLRGLPPSPYVDDDDLKTVLIALLPPPTLLRLDVDEILLSELGGIPGMIPICDTTSLPEVHVALLNIFGFSAHGNLQVRACVMIQNSYCDQREQKLAAASMTLGFWKMHKAHYYAAQ